MGYLGSSMCSIDMYSDQEGSKVAIFGCAVEDKLNQLTLHDTGISTG